LEGDGALKRRGFGRWRCQGQWFGTGGGRNWVLVRAEKKPGDLEGAR